MIHIIPALIFILMAVADGQEETTSAVSLAKFNPNLQTCSNLVTKMCHADNAICQTNEGTEYIFEPIYKAYKGLPGLNVEIAKDSPVRCTKVTVDKTSHHPQATQCCMPFDYNSKTIQEIRCDGCKTTMKINPTKFYKITRKVASSLSAPIDLIRQSVM